MADAQEANTDATENEQNNDANTEEQAEEEKEKAPISAKDQREEIKKVGLKVQQVGEIWYPIDKLWYDSWEKYTMFDKADSDIPGGVDSLGNDPEAPRPGQIDNSKLQAADNPKALKLDIQENRTHVWLHSEIYLKLQKWYGAEPNFPRKVYEKGSGSYSKEKYICIHPQIIKLFKIDAKDPKFIPDVKGLMEEKAKLQVLEEAEEKLGEAVKQVNEYIAGGDDAKEAVTKAQEYQAAAATKIQEATTMLADGARIETLNKFKQDYEDKFEEGKFPMDHTLKQMQTEFEEEMEWKEEDKPKNDSPLVHIWLPFENVKAIYPVDKKNAKVTLEELETVNKTMWVEVPDDYLKTKLDDIYKKEIPPTMEELTSTECGDDDENKSKIDELRKAIGESKKQLAALKEKAEKDEVAIYNDKIIVIENKQTEDPVWPRGYLKHENWRETLETGDIIDVCDTQDKWYESVVRYVFPPDSDKAGKCCIHYIGWNVKWDEEVECKNEERLAKRHAHTKGPHRPKKREAYGGGYYDTGFSFWQNENGAPDQRGVVGLRNLGNTCFMNSTIQCLAQSPRLTDYFLKNDYMHDVNKNNPLGWGGRVAKAWAVLLHDMFSGKYRVVAPRQFKSAIGEVAPRFMGYAQQDSQELLSFLLDGLHEDLNKVKNKPATEAVESKGRPDHIVAMDAWKTYLLRNQSEIVNLLQGQYKSKVKCPDCGRVSITFDPYMFLSVPLPTEKYKIIEYTFVDADTSKPPTVFGQKMLKVADIQMLKEAVSKKQGVSKDELFVCDIWKSKIHRELRRHDSVSDINRKSDDIFIYYSKRPVDKMDEWREKAKAIEAAINEKKKQQGGQDNEDSDQDDGRGEEANGKDKKDIEDKWQTFVVNNQHRVVARQQYMHGGQQRYEDEPLGYPLLLTLPINIKMTINQIRQCLWEIIKPFLNDENLQLNDENLPFQFWAAWGFNQHCKLEQQAEEIPLDEQEFDLKQRNLKFLVHWNDPKQYKSGLYEAEHRPRDESAPPALDSNGVSSIGSSYDEEERRGKGKPIELNACIEAFCEKETLSENDAWYCSKCKDFKCASKKIDLWNSPDLLIIHLKRFSYTRNWRDRINTLVRFPIEGLDLSRYLLDEQSKKDAIYDLYAVSNHMGGMGGGHYTAYAKNLDNKQWYHLDDSRTSKVSNPETVIGSAAYVLYYYRRNPKNDNHRASAAIKDLEAAEQATLKERLVNQLSIDNDEQND